MSGLEGVCFRGSWVLWLPLGALTFLGTGCSEQRIESYVVPADAPPRMAGGAAPNAEGSEQHLHWELPEGWVETSASGVRTATFRIQDPSGSEATVAVMPFKRMGGSDLQFVNLWRTSLDLEPIEEDQLNRMVEEVVIGDKTGKLYDVLDQEAGPTAQIGRHIIVAMAVHLDTSWFFKLDGDLDLVEAQKEPFRQFLKTIEFHEADAHGAPAEAEPGSTFTATDSDNPTWVVPEDWQEAPPTAMVEAKYLLTDDQGGNASMTVSVLSGDGGGLLANVNRWRGQLGMSAVDLDEMNRDISTLDVAGGPASLVDVQSDNGQRLLAAVVPHHGRTWFFKLMGDASVAAKHKDAFLKFLASIEFPHA